MKYTVTVSQRAQQEITEAFLWYEEKQSGVGKKLLKLLEEKFTRILQNPHQYPTVHKSIRRALVKKFPYSVFYFVDNDTIEVLAFFHMKRKPIRWK